MKVFACVIDDGDGTHPSVHLTVEGAEARLQAYYEERSTAEDQAFFSDYADWFRAGESWYVLEEVEVQP